LNVWIGKLAREGGAGTSWIVRLALAIGASSPFDASDERRIMNE